ncbi:MAG: DUF302 domain-containing protein [Polyangia bacterium]
MFLVRQGDVRRVRHARRAGARGRSGVAALQLPRGGSVEGRRQAGKAALVVAVLRPVENAPAYGFTTKLVGQSLADARGRVEQALKDQGFGVLTEIDVQATLKKKLGADFRPYVILGACNPQLAQRALTGDLGVGLLLPCNVVLWGEEDGTVVSIADPRSMFQIVNDPRLEPIAEEAERRLRGAFEALCSD